MPGAARHAPPTKRDAIATSSATRPELKAAAGRRRTDSSRHATGLENTSNASEPSNMDPYDIMGYDGWSVPRDKAPGAQKSNTGSRELLRKRAPGAKKDSMGANKSANASILPRSVPLENPSSSTDVLCLGPTGRDHGGPQSKNQVKKRLPGSEAMATKFASYDESSTSKRRPSPDVEGDTSRTHTKRQRARRLIDDLVEQAGESSDEEPKYTEIGRNTQVELKSRREKGETSETPRQRTCRGLKPPSSVKFTYGAQRSILREAGSDDPHGDLSLLQPLSTPLPPVSSGLEFALPEGKSDDEDTTHQGAVRSIHELRQAGVNDRFADEIDDLLERVGSPGETSLSLRRNALLEMAVKLHKKQFLRQFRDYRANSRLFGELGKEDDIISGFALVSALLTLLTGNAAPRASKYLQSGITRLLQKLLHQQDDITFIAGQRSTNLSRNSRATIASLKSATLKNGQWERRAAALSPRSLSLKFISVAFESPEGQVCIQAFEGLAPSLFSILRLIPLPEFVDDCSEVVKEDCSVVASVLQELSLGAVTSSEAKGWTDDYPNTISAALDATLQRGVRVAFEESLLKLAMNCTNNNPPAAAIWHQTGRLGNVATAACACFIFIKEEVAKGDWDAEGYNRLLLILGLMINLCEHAPSSEISLDTGVLDNLIRVYLGSYSSTQEVRCLYAHPIAVCKTKRPISQLG